MTKVEIAKSLPFVASVKEWRGGSKVRHYVNLKSYDGSFRGCRSFRLYIEDDKLIAERGKGMTPRTFDADLEALQEALR